ncbi:MAG: NADPH:quinone reductase [Candidatus Hydrogenedentes bacterium]|nr:NADPH:quinone reductase [Candidatus Hydrogenedentota bacterium]
MKAIQVTRNGGPEVLTLAECPDPTPGPGEVLLRIHAAGVNPVDTYIRAGTQGYACPLPYTPGADGAGVVAAVGDGVSQFKPGDRVYCAGSLSGAYAQFTRCREAQVHPLPENTPFEAGACLGIPYATACRALFHRAFAAPGEWVLVHGASGGVGLAAVQWCTAKGIQVIGTARTEAGREAILRAGAAAAFDHSGQMHFEACLEQTGGRGLDVILEMLANVNLGLDLLALAPRGRVVVIGSRGDVQITPRELMKRDAAIFGMSLANIDPEELAGIHAEIVTHLANGALNPVIGAALPLQDAPTAHQRVIEGPACGNLVLIP